MSNQAESYTAVQKSNQLASAELSTQRAIAKKHQEKKQQSQKNDQQHMQATANSG